MQTDIVAAPLTSEPRLESFAAVTDRSGTWADLALRTANVFSTWEWAACWLRHFPARRELRLTAVCRGQETVAILPIEVGRGGPIAIARFIGHGVADQLQPVCDDCTVPEAIGALRAILGRSGGVLVAERLPGDRDWSSELHGRVIHRDRSPMLDLKEHGNWEGYLASRSPNFRGQVRRRARRLTRELRLRYRLVTTHDELPAAFDALLWLHSARWGRHSQAFSGRRERFHRAFAALALERGWLRLWLAEAQGSPIAAWYGFRYAGVESFYQVGRDPAFARFGVGSAILEHSIREAFADGMREYRLLRGGELYKQRYATGDRGLLTVAASSTRPGRAAVAAADELIRTRAGKRLVKSVGRA